MSVTDLSGAISYDSLTVTVANEAPTATLQNNSGVIYGNSAIAILVNPFDPSPADTTADFRYTFSLYTDTTG